MNKYSVRKINTKNGKTYTGTVIAKDEKTAKVEALDTLNPKVRADYEIIVLTSDPVKMKSRLDHFVERYGFMPQYGDEEATGWMDAK